MSTRSNVLRPETRLLLKRYQEADRQSAKAMKIARALQTQVTAQLFEVERLTLSEAGKILGVGRQRVWQILNPSSAKRKLP